MSKKYSKSMTIYFEENRNSNSIEYIAREFLTLMKQKCEKCMRYRTECALNPHCKDRRYINILVDLNVKPDELPSFCYLQHVRSVKNFLKEKPNLFDPVDAKIYLKDFLKIIGVKKALSKNVERISSNLDVILGKLAKRHFHSDYIESRNYYVFSFNESINLIDFDREIVTINLKYESPSSEEELHSFIIHYQKMFDLEVEIIEEIWGWWNLKITFANLNLLKENLENFEEKLEKEIKDGNASLKAMKKKFKNLKQLKQKIKNFDKEIITSVIEKLEGLCDKVQYHEDENELVYLIDIKTPKNQNWSKYKFNLHKIKKIFESISRITD